VQEGPGGERGAASPSLAPGRDVGPGLPCWVSGCRASLGRRAPGFVRVLAGGASGKSSRGCTVSPHPCARPGGHQPPPLGQRCAARDLGFGLKKGGESGERKERAGAGSGTSRGTLPAPCVTGCGCCQRRDEEPGRA